MQKQSSRVVITGLGLISSLGNDVGETWSNLYKGQSGIKDISQLEGYEDFKELKYRQGALCTEFPFKKYALPHSKTKLSALMHKCFLEATEDANLTESQISTSAGDKPELSKAYERICKDGYKYLPRMIMLQILPSVIIGELAEKYGIHSNISCPSVACASGSQSIGEAYRLIKHGYSQIALAGGLEPICPFLFHAFNRIGALALTDTLFAPFDVNRRGFVIGEGAGVMLLEDYQHAMRRGAKIYAEVSGFGVTNDGYHLVQPEPTGKWNYKAANLALSESGICINSHMNVGISPSSVRCINAHATSTKLGDEVELDTMARVFEDLGVNPEDIYVTANKGALGHTLSACGGVESVLAVLSLYKSQIPKILNLHNPIQTKFKLAIENIHEVQNFGAIMKNTFAFGGINTCLIFNKLDSRNIQNSKCYCI